MRLVLQICHEHGIFHVFFTFILQCLHSLSSFSFLSYLEPTCVLIDFTLLMSGTWYFSNFYFDHLNIHSLTHFLYLILSFIIAPTPYPSFSHDTHQENQIRVLLIP